MLTTKFLTFDRSEPSPLILANPEAEAEAEAEEEMDIDDTTTGTVGDESAYIGDNCLSTPVRNCLSLLLSVGSQSLIKDCAVNELIFNSFSNLQSA